MYTSTIKRSKVQEDMYMISGHSKMFSLPNGRIAKPYSENERLCYKIAFNKKSPITKYIAHYYGSCCIENAPEIEDKPHSELYKKSHSEENLNDAYPPSPLSECHKYIILHNLEEGYKKPCMLDIKMGTRMHWDGAPPEKVERHKYTCRTTTSGSVGLRICGLRLHNRKTDTWIYEEKAWGKKLTEETIVSAIALFFYDGYQIRTDLMKSILEKLCEIRDIVQKSTWRFWSSSLLFVYDNESSSKVDIHLIDFANCNFSGDYDTPDEGYLLGLNNLIAIIRLIQNGAISKSDIIKSNILNL